MDKTSYWAVVVAAVAALAIHAGDWLVKLLLMSVVLSVWPKGGRGSKRRRGPGDLPAQEG